MTKDGSKVLRGALMPPRKKTPLEEALMELTSPNGLMKSMDAALRKAVVRILGANSGMCFTFNHDKLLRPEAHCSIAAEIIKRRLSQGIIVGEGLTGRAVKCKKALLLDSQNVDDQCWQKMMDQLGITAAIIVPMLVAGKAYGTLEVYSDVQGHIFADKDIWLMLDIAEGLAGVIANERSAQLGLQVNGFLDSVHGEEGLRAALFTTRRTLCSEAVYYFSCQEEGGLSLVSSSEGPEFQLSPSKLDHRLSLAMEALSSTDVQIQGDGGRVPLIAVCVRSSDGSSDPLGVLMVEESSGCELLPSVKNAIQSLAGRLGTAIELFHAQADAKRQEIQAYINMAKLIDWKDAYTGGHSERVAAYAVALAKMLGLSDGKIEWIRIAARLHDIGKISIPDCILQKPGILTPEERTIMQSHAENSAVMVEDWGTLPPWVVRVIRYHHLQFGGKGYPDAESLAIFDDIMNFVLGSPDTFDAMFSSRAYRAEEERKFSIQAVVLELIRCSHPDSNPGSKQHQFHAEHVEAFLRALIEGVPLSYAGADVLEDREDEILAQLTPEDIHEIGVEMYHRAFLPDKECGGLVQVISPQTAQVFVELFPSYLGAK